MVDIPWPTSSNPGDRPGEGAGQLVNSFAYTDAGASRWKALPGLTPFVALPPGEVRGSLEVGSLSYVVVGEKVVQIAQNATTTVLEGNVAGEGPVTMARNNALVPDITISSETGDYVVVGSAVRTYPDSNLPQTNSVTVLDGFLLWTTADADIWASDLNGTGVNALSDARAEARPDGLLRGVAFGEQYFAFGENTIEVWQDQGLQPFPLSRSNVIASGLIGPWALAGFEDSWPGPMIYVAPGNVVNRLDGVTPTAISPPDLNRLIEAVTDKTTLRASVYTFQGNSIWSLSSPTWTWEFNFTTGNWHERESVGKTRWRGGLTLNAFGNWYAADVDGGALYSIDSQARTEGSNPLIWGMDSGAVKQFPSRIQVPDAAFDFVLGQAPIGFEPRVMLQWSHDGGATWSKPVVRSLGKQGKTFGRITLTRLGLTTHHGIRFRFRVSDPIYTSFAGARMDAEQR